MECLRGILGATTGRKWPGALSLRKKWQIRNRRRRRFRTMTSLHNRKHWRLVLTENAKSDTAALPDQFEAALGELESIVAQMEDNSMSLEASIAAYERGVRLARVCQDKLDTAEQQISVLRNNMLVPLADPGSSES